MQISGICIFSMTSFIVCIGQGDPAIMPVLICEKSVFGKFSWFSIAINIVGPPWKQVIFSLLMQSSPSLGENAGIGDIVTP